MVQGCLENREGKQQVVGQVPAGIRSARVRPAEIRSDHPRAALHQVQRRIRLFNQEDIAGYLCQVSWRLLLHAGTAIDRSR